jgi:hypothetical protein
VTLLQPESYQIQGTSKSILIRFQALSWRRSQDSGY